MKLEQVLRQKQSLILSPQMQQAIRLLQLPTQDLKQEIQQEITANPLLEIDDDEKKEASEDTHTPDDTSAESENNEGETAELEFREEFEKLLQIDDEWKEYFRQAESFRKPSKEDEQKRHFLETSLTSEETLAEHLFAQLNLSALSDEQKKIGELIIGNIDEQGYLSVPPAEIAESNKIPLDDILAVLQIIQTLHPPGIGAQNVKECLEIQLDKLDLRHSLAYTIVHEHLDNLGKKKFHDIAHALHCSLPELQKAITIIEKLDPKPGRMFGSEKSSYIIPDVTVEKIDGTYEIIMNDEIIPHLKISDTYRTLIYRDDINKPTKSYIKDKIKGGLWFIKNIRQRQQTIYNISRAIITVQTDFLDHGMAYLKPLTMQQVADVVGIHEATVSRAVANKYIQTPQGIFELKFFFTSGITTSTGEEMSSRNIKQELIDLIAQEDRRKPLSDEKIIEIFAQKGINIARRTVAKYREQLKILPSHLRKQL